MDLIFFDMDNTLINSDKAHIVAFQEAFKKFGLKKISSKKLKKMFGIPGKFIIKELFPTLSEKEVEKVVNYHDDYLVKKSHKYLKLFKGVKGILKRLSKRYRLGLLSNCKMKEIIASLKAVDIDCEIFDVIIGNDNVKRAKPYPDEILKAEKCAKQKAKYMVGDSIYDVKAGKNAGVKTIAIASGNFSKKELNKEKPSKLLNNIRELEKVL
jgi:pyrophosphatase PpaX